MFYPVKYFNPCEPVKMNCKILEIMNNDKHK